MNLDTPKGVQLFNDPYSKYTIKQENSKIEKISTLKIMSGSKTKFSKIFFKARYFYQSGESSFHIAEVMGWNFLRLSYWTP